MSRKNRSRNQEGNTETQRQSVATAKKASPIKYIAISVGVLLVIAAVFAFGMSAGGGRLDTSSGSASQPVTAGSGTGTLATTGADGVQEVQVTMANGYQYMPNPIRLKVGVPVRLVVDMNTVTGCMRSIQIPELGVAKNVRPGDNVITFTPQKAGTFLMRCSMNMGQGQVIVEDANGNAPAATAAAATPTAGAGSGGGCGMMGAGGGGCGCGGGA